MEYKAEWHPHSINEEFWNEVFVGKKVVKVNYDDDGLSSLELDSGEIVYVPIGDKSIYVKEEI